MRTVVVIVALVLAGCAGATTNASSTTAGADADTTSATQPPTTVPPTDAPGTTTAGESSPVTRPAPNPDRPLAPDFSLTLSDGTVYEYASEVRPVFMVFWAEW